MSPESPTPPAPHKTESESAIQIAQLTTAEIVTSETTAMTAVATTGRRQVFREIRREMDEGDLASKGVQKLLLNELETSEGECEVMRAYIERYHEADKRAAVLEEHLKSNTGMEIMFAVGLTIGGVCIGWAPTLWDGSSKGPIALAIGVVLVVGSGVAKAFKR
ncbi:MAG: hypothetical protein WCC22_07520 [Terriglobales bacterium]